MFIYLDDFLPAFRCVWTHPFCFAFIWYLLSIFLKDRVQHVISQCHLLREKVCSWIPTRRSLSASPKHGCLSLACFCGHTSLLLRTCVNHRHLSPFCAFALFFPSWNTSLIFPKCSVFRLRSVQGLRSLWIPLWSTRLWTTPMSYAFLALFTYQY